MSHYSRNYKPTRQAAKKNKMVGTRNIKPSSYKAQFLIEAKDQKKAHIKGQKTQKESLQVTADT